MTYDSLDTIPLKLFLKILHTKDFTLLTTESNRAFDVEAIWKQLESEFKALDPNNDVDKLLKTLIKVERYTAQYNAIKMAIPCLKFERDLDLENRLREQGFKLSETNFLNDLERIDLESESIMLLINEHSAKLPKKDSSNKKATNIDEVILGYCYVTGLQYTDTNIITVTQFYGLKNIFNEKVKAVEMQKSKNQKK